MQVTTSVDPAVSCMWGLPAGMQPRGGRPPPRLPPSYEEEESRAAAGRRRLASPDWVRQEVARNKWSPLRDQQASTVGSLTDSEELLDDRHLEEQLRHSHQPPPHVSRKTFFNLQQA